MQYSEVKPLLDDNKFVEICLITGKKPGEVAREILEIRKECEDWNRCHIEYGTLMDVTRTDYDYGSYTIEVSYEGRVNKRGGTTYTCKTGFISDNGKLFNDYKNFIGAKCRFYVGYVENKKDGSVFRALLAVERV